MRPSGFMTKFLPSTIEALYSLRWQTCVRIELLQTTGKGLTQLECCSTLQTES